MGYLVDRLAVIIDSLQSVRRRLTAQNNIGEARELQAAVIDPLNSISVEVDGSVADVDELEVRGATKRNGRLSWSCCHGAMKTRNRSGKTVWVATCRWKRGRREGVQIRRISGSQREPKRIRLNGRTVRAC